MPQMVKTKISTSVNAPTSEKPRLPFEQSREEERRQPIREHVTRLREFLKTLLNLTN
jgi:hypothetical protein